MSFQKSGLATSASEHLFQVEAFESLGAIRTNVTEVLVTGGEEPEYVGSVQASVSLLRTLRVNPRLGRGFAPSDLEGRPFDPDYAASSAALVALVSHRYWQQRLAGDPDVVGETLSANGRAYTIIGVMPADFFFLQDMDLWFPLWPGGPSTGARNRHDWTVVGRLAEGMTLEQAQSRVDVVSAQLQEAYPASNTDKGLDLSPLRAALVDQYDEMLVALMAALGLVLLIACGNVAGLLLVKGASRAREFSVRAAIGATSGRLARQLLCESLILTVVAGGFGLLLAVLLKEAATGRIALDLW